VDPTNSDDAKELRLLPADDGAGRNQITNDVLYGGTDILRSYLNSNGNLDHIAFLDGQLQLKFLGPNNPPQGSDPATIVPLGPAGGFSTFAGAEVVFLASNGILQGFDSEEVFIADILANSAYFPLQ